MKRKTKWIALLLMAAGLVLLSFGVINKHLEKKELDREYAVYTQQTLPEETDDGSLEAIRAYNDSRADYDKIPELLGWIVIDKISLKYPVYRTTENDSLSEGIVHVIGTDLPAGDDKTDTMLMGHNGEAGKALFTHLDELENGDTVVLDFKTGTYTYTVTGTEVVEPELVHLYKDRSSTLTLMTCTPYGSNTHRLLVHCKIK